MNTEPYIIKPTLNTADDVEQLARKLMDAHGLQDWAYKVGNAKRWLGLCAPGKKTIYLNSRLIADNIGKLTDEIEHTILHEIAHALNHVHETGCAHDKNWKRWCIKLGINDSRLAVASKYMLVYNGGAETMGEYQSLPEFADILDHAMIAGKPETLGKLEIYVRDGGDYVPQHAAPIEISTEHVRITETLALMKDNKAATIRATDTMPTSILLGDWKHDKIHHAPTGKSYLAQAMNGENITVAMCKLAEIIANTRPNTKHLTRPELIATPGAEIYAVRLDNIRAGVHRCSGTAVLAMSSEKTLTILNDAEGVATMTTTEAKRIIAGFIILDLAEGGRSLISTYGLTGKQCAALELTPRTDNYTKTVEVIHAVKKVVKEQVEAEEDGITEEEGLEITRKAAEYINLHNKLDVEEFVEEITDNNDVTAILTDKIVTIAGGSWGGFFDISPGGRKKAIKAARRAINIGSKYTITMHADAPAPIRDDRTAKDIAFYQFNMADAS